MTNVWFLQILAAALLAAASALIFKELLAAVGPAPARAPAAARPPRAVQAEDPPLRRAA